MNQTNNNTNNNTISLTSYEYNNYLLNINNTNTLPQSSNITPQKRLHHLITPEFNHHNNNKNTKNTNDDKIKSRDIDIQRLRNYNQIKRVRSNMNGNNKLINELRNRLRTIFECDNPSGIISLNEIYCEPAMIKLIEAMVPSYSLGNGWIMKHLPSSIPDYPFFNNQYNAKYGNSKPLNHYNYHIGQNVKTKTIKKIKKIKIRSNNNNNNNNNIETIPAQYEALTLYTAQEWDNFDLDQQANIWSEHFKKHVANYKYKIHRKENILEQDKITANMLSFGLQVNILYILKIIDKHQNISDCTTINGSLFKYYMSIKELLILWEKYIELNNFDQHIITYLINCLLIVGHAFLIQGILIQQIENNEMAARQSYIKCIHRIRRVHKHWKIELGINNNENNENDGELENRFKIEKGWDPLLNISYETLGMNCCEWNWLHFDLNRDEIDVQEIGPYDGWIIESYYRLSWTYDAGSSEKLNCLHGALKLLRNKDGLGDIVAIKIIIDYAYTFLERNRKCSELDKYYWFYLINITFGLINMNPQNGLTSDEIFDIKTSFLCGCIENKLCSQPNYISFMQNFVKNNMNKNKTCPSLAIHRLLKIAYVAMYYGEIRESNDLYRSARALMQYYTNQQLKNSNIYPFGSRLMDEFEIWWSFNHFCIYSIATITSYSIINYDSSYFNLLWDWVCWRNQCSRMMFKIGGLPNDKNAKFNKYYGYFNEYKSTAQDLAFFGAQAMILGVIHSANNCKLQPDYKYLYTIVLLLEMAKKNVKFKHHCEILGHYMEQQFELFAFTPQRKRELSNVIVID